MELSENPKDEILKLLSGMEDGTSFSQIRTEIIEFIDSKVPQRPQSKVWKSLIGRKVFIVTSLLTILTILIVSNSFDFHFQKVIDLITYSTWIIVPPAWFLYEYTILFPEDLKLDPVHLADLKYTQELAGKIWGAVVVLISAILYMKYQGKPF